VKKIIIIKPVRNSRGIREVRVLLP